MVALGKEVIEAWISCFQLQPRTLRFMATSGTDSSNDSWIRYRFHGFVYRETWAMRHFRVKTRVERKQEINERQGL